MPHAETITIGGRTAPAVNLYRSVGMSGDNFEPDVMLIQTLFHYLASVRGKSVIYNGFPDEYLPSISGKCDHDTKRAILMFQQRHARRLLKIDGLIEPGSYEGRNIRSSDDRVMTITLFHLLSIEAHWHHPDAYYIDGLIRILPELRPWLS